MRALLGASAIISAGIVAGRFAGVARDVALAAQLGVGRDADVAVLVLSFPDLLTTVLVGGVVSAVLIPDFSAARAAGGAGRLFRTVSLLVGLTALGIAALAAALAPLFVRLLGPGLAPDAASAATPLFAVAALVFPLTALAAVSTGFLQAHGRFAVPAAGTLLFNLTLIAVLVFAVRPAELGWLALGAVAGAALRWGSQLVAARRLAVPGGTHPERLRDLAGLARRYPQALVATSAIVLMPFVARTLASLGSPGDVAALTYALRIVEFPLGAFLTVGSVAALPHLAELVVAHRREEAAALLGQLLTATVALTIPITIALIGVAGGVATVLFGHGATEPDAVARIAAAAAVALASLPAQSVNAALTAVYVAERRLTALLVVNLSGLALFAAVAAPLTQAGGVRGIALAYVAVHWALSVTYVLDLGRRGSLGPARPLVRPVVAAAGVGALVMTPLAVALRAAAPSALPAVLLAGAAALLAIGCALVAVRWMSRRPVRA